MCTTCGCGAGETRVGGKTLPEQDDVQHGGRGHAPPRQAAQHGRSGQSTMNYTALGDAGIDHHHGPGGWHRHAHPHPAAPAAGDRSPDLLPSTGRSRMLQIERDILARNDRHAADNRRRFEEQGIFALNLVSSPGSGKTSLLCRSIEALKEKLSLAVIEGDQQTSHDADRIRATGVPALQINTGKGSKRTKSAINNSHNNGRCRSANQFTPTTSGSMAVNMKSSVTMMSHTNAQDVAGITEDHMKNCL